MDFSRRKLPQEAALNLRLCPIASVRPYALMLAPVYVFMRINEKFISIKGPLDFFTPEELERLQPFESLFFPPFVDEALVFRQAARRVRSLIAWQPSKDGREQLPPAPYEVSDAVLRLIGPLWAAGCSIEPYFAAVLANEVCDLLPESLLLESRERDVGAYERAVLRSGWAVFLALHLGYCDLGFLNALRLRVFREAEEGRQASDGEVGELLAVVSSSLDRDPRQAVSAGIFEGLSSRAACKMSARLRRIREQIPRGSGPAPTIFGERGFVDVA